MSPVGGTVVDLGAEGVSAMEASSLPLLLRLPAGRKSVTAEGVLGVGEGALAGGGS